MMAGWERILCQPSHNQGGGWPGFQSESNTTVVKWTELTTVILATQGHLINFKLPGMTTE